MELLEVFFHVSYYKVSWYTFVSMISHFAEVIGVILSLLPLFLEHAPVCHSLALLVSSGGDEAVRGGGGQTQLVRLSPQLPLSLRLFIRCLLHLFLKFYTFDLR